MPHKAPSKKAGSLSLPTEQDLPRTFSVKTEYDSCQGLLWLSQIKKALGLCSTVHLQMVAKLSALFFCGRVRRMVPKKTEGLKRVVGQTARFRNARARGQGKCNPHWQG